MSSRTLEEVSLRGSSTPIRVLLLEHSPSDIELVLFELRMTGISIDHTLASNRSEFLDAIARYDFDAVLADYRLPDWTGLDALEELRALGRDIPFLLVTGTLGEEAAVECIKRGVSDYVLKDHISRLPLALKRALRERTLRVEATRAHEALAQSESRARQQLAELDMVYRSAPVCLAVLDRDLRYLRVNDAIAENHGIPAADFPGRSLREMIPNEYHQAAELFRRVFLTGEAVLNQEAHVHRGVPPNEARDYLASFYPLFASSGEVFAACVVMVDITERKKAEEALHRSEARNRDLVTNSSYGIGRVNQAGKIVDPNPALLRILGCRELQDFASIRTIKDVFRFAEVQAELFENCRREGHVRGAEAEWKRPDGGIIVVRLHLRRTKDETGLDETELIVEDVTELRAMEKQLRQSQKFEAIGQLAGGIAHDFNNVVGAILGWAELGLDQNKENPKTAERFSRIREQAERAAALTRELLAFARRQVLQPKPVDLNNVVGGLVSFLDKVIGKDIELKVVEGKVDSVKADPTQVEQVLMNLCINARDAMPGGGRLMIETAMAEVDESYCRFYPGISSGRYAVLSVSDTGCGMDAETRERIFEPFFTTKEVGKGTGMGLATVYGIVKQHGGFIHVYSEPEQGSLFRVYLPALTEKILSVQAVGVPSSSPADFRGTETILLAEDHESIREMARQSLTGLGYRVLCAADGEEALRLCQNETPALAILDVVMPRLGGLPTASRLTGRFPNIPILFTSGYSQELTNLESPSTNRRYLQKPYSPTTLNRLVRDILDGVPRPPSP